MPDPPLVDSRLLPVYLKTINCVSNYIFCWNNEFSAILASFTERGDMKPRLEGFSQQTLGGH